MSRNTETDGETNAAPVETKQPAATVAVLCRFERDELEKMKQETGANADATAVGCFVRKNLRKGE